MQGNTISTFGGNPVTCAAARATIEVIEEENLVENARVMGNRLREGLDALKEKYPVIGDVRGMGLMQGMELVGEKKRPDAEGTKRLMELTKNHGLAARQGRHLWKCTPCCAAAEREARGDRSGIEATGSLICTVGAVALSKNCLTEMLKLAVLDSSDR